MTLQLGMLVPGAVGLCCTVADRRRRRVADWFPSVVMTLAMADLVWGRVAGASFLVPIAWAALLVVVAVVPAVAVRLGRHSAGVVDRVVAVQHSLGLLTMAALAMMMGGSGSGSASGVADVAASGHQMGAGLLPTVVVGGIAAVGALTVWLIVGSRSQWLPAGRGRALVVVNAASVFGGLVVMALTMV